jgi:hypothetical protein
VKFCSTCGQARLDVRDDGECFVCHVRGIGFTFVGGGGYGRHAFHERTTAEALAEHVGDVRRDGIERVR